MTLVIFAVLLWAVGFGVNVVLANGPARDTGAVRLAVPLIFGLTILGMWELIVRGMQVSTVILPPPSLIAASFAENLGTLWGDFVQTILKGAL
ncbi:MAG: ABC transporter permease, partial [Mameliella sp.]|nr:ABC transporter permease [Mameliella sp.]